jgi:hypothetical protein
MNFWTRVRKFFERSPSHTIDDQRKTPIREPLQPTLELLALPHHGATSFLAALLFMLRELSLVWPEFVCWAQDFETEEALKAMHEQLRQGNGSGPAESGNGVLRYDLLLRNMERWGERRLVVADGRHPPFASPPDAGSAADVNWTASACWLVSLPDLAGTQGEVLDLLFEDLLRARVASGHSLYTVPFKLIVVLTKADAIPNLPPALRGYLKDDPLWRIASAWPALPLTPGTAGTLDLRLDGEALREYLGTMWHVDEEIRRWLEATAAGHLLVRRAAAYHVQLRFAVVSATGSGLAGGASGRLSWSPRRVLDPYFWALELDSPIA